jgi:hypothetical protein
MHGKMRNAYKLCYKSQKGRDNMEDQGKDGKTVLN